MAVPKSRLPDHPKRVRPPVIAKLALAGTGAGAGGVAGGIYLVFARHLPFTARAGVFEDIAAVIVLLAVAIIALTVSLDHVARSRLRYRAGELAVATVQSHAQALQTYRTLHSSLSLRWLRSLLGLPDGDGDGEGEGEGEDEDGGGKAA